MATQTRVPGAASSEVDFELERFERTAQDRIEISGRWYGLRGRRFVRPVLNLNAGGARRRAIALLEHKPWAADDGQTWLAAFRWPDGAGDVSGAELEVGPGLVVELPAPGGKPGAAGRVSALRPHVPTPPRRQFHAADEGLGGDDDGAAGEPRGRELSGRAAPDTSDFAAGTAPEWSPAPAREASRGRAAAPEWGSAPARDSSGGAAAAPGWAPAPPRDVVTAALAERDEAVAARDRAEQERVTALNDRDDALSRRDAALRDVDRAAAERDEAFAERDRLTTELERVTRERDIAYAERSRTLQDSEAVERARDQAAAERDGARSELARAIPAREDAIGRRRAAGRVALCRDRWARRSAGRGGARRPRRRRRAGARSGRRSGRAAEHRDPARHAAAVAPREADRHGARRPGAGGEAAAHAGRRRPPAAALPDAPHAVRAGALGGPRHGPAAADRDRRRARDAARAGDVDPRYAASRSAASVAARTASGLVPQRISARAAPLSPSLASASSRCSRPICRWRSATASRSERSSARFARGQNGTCRARRPRRP